jgi:hypothetical protein
MTYTYFIGIDPGADSGFAVWHKPTQAFTELKTLSFWEVAEKLEWYKQNIEGVFVRLEAPQHNPAMHQKTLQGAQGRKALRMAQNVGQNKKEAQLLAELLIRLELPHELCRPTKHSGTKLKHEQFALITGITKKHSQHVRDAAMLVYSR